MRGILIAVALVATPALAAEEHVEWEGSDEVTITYPERDEHSAAPYLVIRYHNNRLQTSQSGEQTVETRYGPITLHVRITGGPEIMTVVQAPEGMIAYPPEITVEDGDSDTISLLPPMM